MINWIPAIPVISIGRLFTNEDVLQGHRTLIGGMALQTIKFQILEHQTGHPNY